jgi:hypothetical protein
VNSNGTSVPPGEDVPRDATPPDGSEGQIILAPNLSPSWLFDLLKMDVFSCVSEYMEIHDLRRMIKCLPAELYSPLLSSTSFWHRFMDEVLFEEYENEHDNNEVTIRCRKVVIRMNSFGSLTRVAVGIRKFSNMN